MKIKLLTIGTRGDVQPFIALARGLQNNGHDVVICTSQDFEGFVRGHGVGFGPIQANIMKLAQSAEGKRMLGSNPLEIMKQMKKLIYPMMQQMLDDLWTASQDADCLIYHPKAFAGYDIAQKLNIPVFAAHPIPIIVPTGAFTNPILPFTFRNRWLNEKSYHLNRFMLLSFKKMLNTWRRDTLHLPPRSLFSDDLHVNGRDIPVLYGCSPSIIPFDPKWKDRVCMEGFWFLEDTDWDPPRELESFIASGSSPIVISYSSMPLKHPDHVLEMTMQALRQTGQRGIILVGWSGMQVSGNGAENILCIQEAPHAWLFPRAAGVIHHGGAGTTAAVLRAGKPMTISPFNADQPFWAKRIYELGVSTKPIPEKSMSVASLAERIAELTSDSTLTANVMALSDKISEERGVDRTVEFIERRLHHHF
ncbi:glycosyltransferase [Paenibacillus sp. MDMC362]|uniref:glycosyltransferase n=1 Tax=Paenibacillus sp. MDMC362 TaxID=2977365 RepID=UPI000DC46E2D|nr:glycosyltransferase [Paenibacillus sp. MDMC362]RAR43883.1 glycosyltransferase [Paenibacillus sp. MDMC362]